MFKNLFNFEKLWDTVKSNGLFLLQFVGIIAGIILLAYLLELVIRKKNNVKEKVLTTRKIAVIGIMSAIGAVLMLFEIPLWFAPGFYKLDFSELPILLCAFAYGPVAGVVAEAVKILVNLVLDGTGTAFVGELANFVVGSIFVLSATSVYHIKKNKKMAIVGCVVGVIVLTVAGSAMNGFYMIPKFAEMFMPMEAIIGMGAEKNANVNSVWTLVFFCVVPFNLLKGTLVSAITILLYRPLRPVLKKTIE